MEQRRFLLFLTLSMAVLFAWVNFGPLLFPGLFPQPMPKDAGAVHQQAGRPLAFDEPPVIAPKPEPVAGDIPVPAAPAPKAARVEKHERRRVALGSLDPETGYFLSVTLTSQGAAVEKIEFSDPRFKDFHDRQKPLQMVGNNVGGLRTLQTQFGAIDAELAAFGQSLSKLDWELAETVPDTQFRERGIQQAATFRAVIATARGRFELKKTYRLARAAQTGEALAEARDNDPTGYLLEFELTLKNLGGTPQTVEYTLQGPVGVPLENIESSVRTFRSIKMGFIDPQTGSVSASSMWPDKVLEAVNGGKPEEWKKPISYIGVDVQFFAALLVPVDDQAKSPYFSVARPVLVEGNAARPELSDVSVELESQPIELAAGEETTHRFHLFAGPKRQALLAALPPEGRVDASPVLEYGWFGFIAKGMLLLLKFLHDLGIPYGLAIICMTMIVRGCMFPISRKQAIGAKKMKELQPKIQELRKKYANDKEKMARAQMELFSKHNYNPFAGCLPIFLQLPIFIGLYTALNNAVDLRLAPFPLTWIDNLAAPDALFQLPFMLPFLGTDDFNLLPIITIALFIVQQKMFMPPPTDKEQELQFKMMNYMMIFMGFLFYKVPAGLCVYFIASSLWGVGERKMLDWTSAKPSTPAASEPVKKEEPQDGKPAAAAAAPTSGGKSDNGAARRARRRERRRSRSQP